MYDMSKMKKIAITGGVASGKTAVMNILRKKGFSCVSSDDISSNLLSKNPEIISKIDLIIPGIVVNGVVDKAKFRRMIFKNPKLRLQVENVMHPVIVAIREKFIQHEEAAGKLCVFCEVPLLFEKNIADKFDHNILVASPIDIRLERFLTRDGMSEDIFYDIVKSQLTDEIKKSRAEFVIKNKFTPDSLEKEIDNILYKIGVL